MTRAEYLTKHGWTVEEIDESGRPFEFADPNTPRLVPAWGGGNRPVTVVIDDAVTIQRARDEEKAQAAWVAFASVAVGQIGEAHVASPGVGPGTVERWAALSADALLAEYRARFGAPATFTDEAT